jgi:hypothetical protein
MLVEAAFVGLIALAWRRSGQKPKMTGERQKAYLSAMEHLADPGKLRKFADTFDKDGFPVEATMLRKRADLREMPQERKERLRAAYEFAMAKADASPEGLEEMANHYEALTFTGSAMNLRERAIKRRAEILARASKPAEVAPEPAKSEPEPAKPDPVTTSDHAAVQ